MLDLVKLKSIMSAVLKLDEQLIDISTSMDTVKSWDSLKHMNLIIALEREFGVDLEDDEVELMVRNYFSILTENNMIKNYQNLSLLEENFQKHGSIFKRIVQKQFETFRASTQEFDQVLGKYQEVLPIGLLDRLKLTQTFQRQWITARI